MEAPIRRRALLHKTEILVRQFLHIAEPNYKFGTGAFGIESPFQGAKPEDDPALKSKTALLEFALASY